MSPEQPQHECRLLVMPPTARDGALTLRLMQQAGIATTICANIAMICREIEAGAGAVLVTEEALAPAELGRLLATLDGQPRWSDLPLILLTRDGADSAVARQALERLGNVVLLERPLRTATLVSAVRMALRGRQRQYQIRAYLAERERRELALVLLAQASTRLAVSLDYEATLLAVAHVPVPDFADWCAVDIVDEHGALQRRAQAMTAEDAPPAIDELDLARSAPVSGDPTSRLYIRPTYAGAAESDRQPSGLNSAIAVPLVARAEPLGVLTFGRIDPQAPYTPGDIELGQSLAHLAAHALDSALLLRETREALAVRDQFISIASHELKTPITSLLGYAAMLQRGLSADDKLEARGHRAIAVIIRQARQLNSLIEQLLNVSGIQRGQFNIQRQLLDFGALTANIVDEFRTSEGGRNLIFDYDARPLMIEGDALRLEQVLQNLLANAIKYSPDGEPVRVRLASDTTNVLLEVQDQGIGIPVEAQAHLFEPYYRSSNTGSAIGGFGLGLYVVREIVVRHGGRVEVDSREGQGTTFRVHLPLRRA